MNSYELADASRPDTLVTCASIDLLSRVLAEVFGADFDRINSTEVTLGDTSPPKFLEAIAIALGGDALATPLPEAIVAGCNSVAESIERAGTSVEDGAEAISTSLDRLAAAIEALVPDKPLVVR